MYEVVEKIFVFPPGTRAENNIQFMGLFPVINKILLTFDNYSAIIQAKEGMTMSVTISAKLTLWVNRFITLVLLALCFLMPALLGWYQDLRPLGPHSAAAILMGFYCCVPAVALALWEMERLLKNILRGAVFVPRNVGSIRRVCRCCLAVALICLPAAVFYPPLVFMAVIMAFLALVVNVVGSVMNAAVAIRDENDLTI